MMRQMAEKLVVTMVTLKGSSSYLAFSPWQTEIPISLQNVSGFDLGLGLSGGG